MKRFMSLLLSVCLLATLSGCTDFRRDVATVSAYGGYTTEQGDSYKAGVAVGLRKPAAK